ncbi:MAG: hypothetical protein AB8B81_22905 [Halioglobus sp.]
MSVIVVMGQIKKTKAAFVWIAMKMWNLTSAKGRDYMVAYPPHRYPVVMVVTVNTSGAKAIL